MRERARRLPRPVSERLRLVLTTHTFLPTVGGAELGVHELAIRLGRRHDVVVLAPGVAETTAEYRPANYRIVRVTRLVDGSRPLRAQLAELTGWAYSRTLIRLHRHGWPVDAVNCHFIRRNTLTAVTTRWVLRVPVILSLVGRSDVVAVLAGPRRARAELMLRVAGTVIANSGYYLRGTRFAGSERIVPYGVDLHRFRPGLHRAAARRRLDLGEQDFVILAVQRLDPVKRVDLLIRALREVLQDVPAAKLLVAGAGPEEPKLRALVDDLGVAAAVRFTGYVAEERLPDVFGLADVFASHSESETFGVTFAEAMAAGLPIIAADTSCIRDVLDSDIATIVEAGSVSRFAGALAELERHPEVRAARGAAARRRAERDFDWESIAAAYEEIIRGSVQARRGRAASHGDRSGDR